MTLGTDAHLKDWENLEAYDFPKIAIIRRVLNKTRTKKKCTITLMAPNWLTKDWYPDLRGANDRRTHNIPQKEGSSLTAPFSQDHQSPPAAKADHLENVKQMVQNRSFPRRATECIAKSHGPSSRKTYQSNGRSNGNGIKVRGYSLQIP